MADLISRAAAMDSLTDTNIERNFDSVQDGEIHRTKRAAIRIIANVPAVDAVPVVHARSVWINPLDPEAKICTWKCSSLCSVCGDYVAVGWKYCQNCGARMDGERRESE